MKGVTTYYENGAAAFSIWQAEIKDEMPSYDGRGNPLLWWSLCVHCRDYVACGLSTKSEAERITRDHVEACNRKEEPK